MTMRTPPSCIQENVPLAPLTTINLGGPARWYARCTSVGELHESVLFAHGERLPLQVFSGGSNIVFADEGFEGLVLNVGLRGVQEEISGGEVHLAVAAGEPWDGIVMHAVEQEWGGIECLSGIPGSTGATPVQNVGAYGQEVAETIDSVRTLDRHTLQERVFTPEECGFAYRESRFKSSDADRFIITEVRFRLKRDFQPAVRYEELARELDARNAGDVLLRPAAVRAAVLTLRRKKSMVIDAADANSRSVGSFFTNPVVPREFLEERLSGVPVPTYPATGGIKLSAAWLVEHAGFPRGFRKGGAGISEHHALAIVNRGGRTSDVIALACEIEEGVKRRFGVQLEREPVVVPSRP
jgi:UDP-N-acetylmuramate dehydrogenase